MYKSLTREYNVLHYIKLNYQNSALRYKSVNRETCYITYRLCRVHALIKLNVIDIGHYIFIDLVQNKVIKKH